jgi:CBS domain-containing protein
MYVEKIMSHQLTTCSPADTLEQAASLMWDGDYGCLPVTSEGNRRIVGILTDRDICMAALFKGKPLREVLVADVMAKTVLTCRATDDIESVQRQMQDEQVRRVPVVDAEGAVIGIVSMADLVCESARSQFMQRREIPASEVMVTLAKISTPTAEVAP